MGILVQLEKEIMHGMRVEGFDKEWQMCITSIVLYSLAMIIELPTFWFVWNNAEVTVGNLRGFSTMFASQAEELMSERKKTELLLTEMLPKSVARQLRRGKLVEAEQYEVG